MTDLKVKMITLAAQVGVEVCRLILLCTETPPDGTTSPASDPCAAEREALEAACAALECAQALKDAAQQALEDCLNP